MKKKSRIYAVVVTLYIVLVTIANISLLTKGNIMKWDIFDAHYPLATFMGDTIRGGELPLWNPMIKYGIPHYALAGTPIWYPITLILAIIGYSPFMMGFEYSLHMVLAGFGMFLLINNYYEKDRMKTYLVGTICGIFYMFSTVFISNAQHVMIFSSATWIPYIILYVRKYIETKKITNILQASGFAGLVFLGGYPEIFAGTFLCLIPYIIIEQKAKIESINIIKILKESFKTYIYLCGFTILAALISLLPFLHSLQYITRGINATVEPMPFSIISFLTAIIPGITTKLNFPSDISMTYCYMGLLTVVTFIAALSVKQKKIKSYLMIVMFVFFMSLGNEFFLYPLFHTYFPLFGSFRFPSVWRCLLALFVLIITSQIWINLDKKEISLKICKIIKGISSFLFIVAIVLVFINYILVKNSNVTELLYISSMCFLASVLIILYYPIINAIKNKDIGINRGIMILVFLGCIEALGFQFFEFPVTIGTFPHGKTEGQTYVDSIYDQYNTRKSRVDYKDSIRTNTPLTYTRDIIFNRQLDENGYMNFILQPTQEYMSSVNRFISTQNPEIFFSNNIVTLEDESLENWRSRLGTDSAQIYVHNNESDEVNSENIIRQVDELSNLEVKSINVNRITDNTYIINNNNVFEGYSRVRKIRLYIAEDNPISGVVEFQLEDGSVPYKIQGNWGENENNGYVDIYFPIGNENITQIKVTFNEPIEIVRQEYIEGDRLLGDPNIEIKNFRNSNIDMQVNLPTSGYVVCQQSFYPGWNVYVDGIKQELTKINGTFMGVYVEEGLHEVEFEFFPIDFVIGLSGTLIYLFILLVFWIRDRRTKIEN